MSDRIQLAFRGAALLLGAFLTYCEVSGTYEYLMKDQGSFNYIVKAGCGVTIGTALLPVFASMAWRAGKLARAALLWLIFPLAVSVVFFAAIDRTGGTADLAQQQRVKEARAGDLAVRTEAEATTALAAATEAATMECNSGPVTKRRGGKCLEAEAKRDAAQARVDAVRAALAAAPVKETDPLAERIAAYTLHYVTEEQVRLYRPLFLPLVLSILAGVFLSLGAHMEVPGHSAGAKAGNRPEAEKGSTIVAPANPGPRVVAPSTSSVPDIMVELLKPATGGRVELEDIFKAYVAACRPLGARALMPEQFADPARRFCHECGIRTQIMGERIYLLDVQLLAR